MVNAKLSPISPRDSVDRPRRNQRQHHPYPPSIQSIPSPQQEQQHSSMLTSLHLLPNPYTTNDFISGSHQATVESLLQPCKGSPQIASETDCRLLGSPRAVAMTVAAATVASFPSDNTANVSNPSIDNPISIYDLAQSRRRFNLRSSFPPSPSPFPSSSPLQTLSSIHPCSCFYNNNYKSMHAQNCSLDDLRRRTRQCQVDRLWLNPHVPQEQQLLLDYPLDDDQSMQWMMEDVKKEVEGDEERYLEFALEEMKMTLSKTSCPKLGSGIDWCLSGSAIETFNRANRIKDDPSLLCAHAAAAAAAASDVTPDRRTAHAAATVLFKHDNYNSSNNDDSSVFGLGVPSLSSSSSPSVSSLPPCYHTCTATSTTALSFLPYASITTTTTTVTPNTFSPPLPLSSATQFLEPSSSQSSHLSVASSLDVNLRSPSPEQPNRSPTIEEASSPFSCSPSLSSSAFILSPPTLALLASASSLSTPSTTITTITTVGDFNLNDCKGSLGAPANPVATSSSSLALNCSSSFTNSITFKNTIFTTPAQQFLSDSEQHQNHLLRYNPSNSSFMCRFNPASNTLGPSYSSYSSLPSSITSAVMSGPFLNPARISLDSNGESTGDTCHHVGSRVATDCDHNHSDSNSGVDLGLIDRNGNLAIHHHPPHRHYQHQAQDGHSDMTSTDEMQLRRRIMARISPQATMMSRTPPALPEVPVGDEPIAHQIRRVHSAHIAELRHQWEDQHQQGRQAQIQEQQQQPLHQHQRHNSYSPSQRSVSMSRFAPVAMERSSPVVMQRLMPSSSTAATGSQLQNDEEVHLRTLLRGSNSLYLNYEDDVLRPEEQWRRDDDDMVGR